MHHRQWNGETAENYLKKCQEMSKNYKKKMSSRKHCVGGGGDPKQKQKH